MTCEKEKKEFGVKEKRHLPSKPAPLPKYPATGGFSLANAASAPSAASNNYKKTINHWIIVVGPDLPWYLCLHLSAVDDFQILRSTTRLILSPPMEYPHQGAEEPFPNPVVILVSPPYRL